MIVRSWSARATPAGADSYTAHFRQKVLPHIQRIPGHRGAMLLRRGVADEVELVALTIWDAMTSVHDFAGNDPSLAVVEPEARAVLKKFDTHVQHFDLIVDSRS
jgi:heme-degrading monooxygenase HmoA